MPAGSGSRPASASSGAVEAECQHEAEADDFDGYADEDGTDDIDDIDDIFKTWYGPPCVLLLLCCYVPQHKLGSRRYQNPEQHKAW